MNIHVVNQGETVWGIAERYRVNINQIIRLNELSEPNRLVVGQALVIPDPLREYVIQPGDTLWTIADSFGVSVEDLAAANHLNESSTLFIGEMLEIPYFYHVVRSGETLWIIAQRYGVTVGQIAAENNIANASTLQVDQRLKIPLNIRPTIDVNAYITNINEEGRDEVLRLGRYFTYLSPFMYSFREDGSLTNLNEELLIEAARSNHVSPMLILTNFRNRGFNSDLAAQLLRNESVQDTLITNVIRIMREKGYDGINLDFEYVYPEDRENYNNFLRRLVSRLHPSGYFVSTALAPKERADQPGLLYEAHDYKAHGEIVDFVILMTYEWGWAGGSPWAIAPINKVRDVLNYAVTDIPSKKILMGVPLYGRDWKIPFVQGTTARTVSPKQAVELAKNNGVAIQYNETYQSPFFNYVDNSGQEHEVWFEDARSMQAKYNTVKQYGLLGVSYWVLGSPFPQNWPVLIDNFSVHKR